jgi:hypothetical protein
MGKLGLYQVGCRPGLKLFAEMEFSFGRRGISLKA